MREIKFRAWDFENKIMLCPNDLFNEFVLLPHNGCFMDITTGEIFSSDEKDESGNQRLIPMQYTGLKDKNGNEIYEGDIVKDTLLVMSKTTNHNMSIEFRQSTFCFKEIPNTAFLEGWHESIKVIGNIYENPELLEVK